MKKRESYLEKYRSLHKTVTMGTRARYEVLKTCLVIQLGEKLIIVRQSIARAVRCVRKITGLYTSHKLWKRRECHPIKARISPSNHDDVHKGWIRISKDLRDEFGIQYMSYVRFHANHRRVYCQIRGTPGEHGRIEINEWYRKALGWDEFPSEEVEINIEQVSNLRRITALSYHPDDAVRIGIALGLISVGLGLLSIIVTIVAPAIRVIASGNLLQMIGGVVSLLAAMALMLFMITFSLGQGVMAIVKLFPNNLEPPKKFSKEWFKRLFKV
jgi:hypothetical protein